MTQGGISTPGADAFYLPADTSRQVRLWLPWPAEDPELQSAITALARAAGAFEPVSLLANAGTETSARAVGCAEISTTVVSLPHTSPRLRDTGPTFLVDGKGGSAAVDWRFNGWGGRGSTKDVDFAHALLGINEVRRFRAPLTLESSSFVADGYDTLLALASAVFDPARNPGLAPLEAFGIFKDWLGVSRVIWLADAHPEDSLNTDIRALAAFVAPGLVAVTAPDSNMSSNHPVAQTITQLQRARDARGSNLDLLQLPAPPPKTGAFSYTNFLALNGGLLVPAFGSPNDTRAADMLAEAFPHHVITLVDAKTFARHGLNLTSLAVPHPARLLERDRATILPRSAWSQSPHDDEEFLQKYIDLANSAG